MGWTVRTEVADTHRHLDLKNFDIEKGILYHFFYNLNKIVYYDVGYYNIGFVRTISAVVCFEIEYCAYQTIFYKV